MQQARKKKKITTAYISTFKLFTHLSPNEIIMQKITIKELAVKMNISCTSAQRLYADVKKELKIKIVTMAHIRQYLKIPHSQNIS